MQRLDRVLENWDRWWLVILSGVIFLAFMVTVLPAQAGQAASYSEGAGSPDTSLFLPPNELYEIALAYGPEGRQQYIQSRWTFDVLFPLVYGFFFLSAINVSFRRIWPARKWSGRLALIAPAAVLADFLENIALSTLMSLYPQRVIGLASLAVALSTLKWLLVSLAMMLAVGGLVGLALRWLWRRLNG